MINYSVSLRKNPQNRDAAAKAYGTAQVTDSLTLSQFAAHISEHHSKYGKGDILNIPELYKFLSFFFCISEIIVIFVEN